MKIFDWFKPLYKRQWVLESGREYRVNTYFRQKKNGSQPLISNPTIEEVKHALSLHNPKSVIEIGCGWGRLLEQLKGEPYSLFGVDLVSMYLHECARNGLQVDQWDITTPYPYGNHWDVAFTRGVMQYFMDRPALMKSAMHNVSTVAHDVVIFEWPEVCEKMKEVYPSRSFHYHPIKHLAE